MSKEVAQYGVSIRLMTFNHEKYIREAMDGIFMQETNFRVEIVVGDDFSSDKTLEIIRSYNDTERIHINILNRDEGDSYWQERQKKGRLYNFSNILENCTGKYVALLDGDDYWIHKHKLQHQYDFMESNKECSVCFTAARFSRDSRPDAEEIYRPNKVQSDTTFSVKQVIRKSGEFMPTASIFFKGELIQKIPEWVFSSSVGDMPLTLFLGTRGDFGYINIVSCVYRIMAAGSWSAQMSYEHRRTQVKGFLKTLNDFNEYTKFEYSDIVRKEKNRIVFNDRKSIVKRKLATSLVGKWIKKILGQENSYYTK